ncbi:class I SAM-dependent methyltransferase [Amycolatopsis sp. NPDC059021]|uniref:class I SAM-dependent methyltransferase n=1 Tax=Amycolatopsis sp. NPDC059021 TaxID=3346704 RepID=UPI00366B42AB
MDFDSATTEMMATNEANWDERTPIHVASRFYGVGESRDPDQWFLPFEWEDLGELAGRDLVHLQCHLGTETIAFARKGARTAGLDFSGEAVEAAKRIAREAGLDVEYVRANVYDAVDAFGGNRFDIVYTGKGSVFYLPDLTRWASVVAGLLRPGGMLYVVDFHPVLNALGPEPGPGEGQELLLRHDYLEGRGALERDASRTYTDGPALQEATTIYEWRHGFGELITALVGAGFAITGLRESELLPWPRWENMVPADGGWWRLPDSAPRIPLLYALKAVKA